MHGRILGLAGSLLVVTALAACGDSDDGGGGDSAACEPAGSSVEVSALDELAFDAEEYSAEAGCIELTYVNEGNLPHTLLVKDVDDFKLSVGDTDEGVVELEPGTYTLYCDIAGHEAAGMHAELTVE